MAEDEERKHDPEALKEVLYRDAITEKTERIGRTLLTVGTLTLVIGMFDIRATSSALIPLDFSHSPEALGVLLSVFTLFLLASYCLRFSTDVFRGRDDWAEIEIQLHLEKADQAIREARQIDQDEYEHQKAMRSGYEFEPDPYWDDAMKIDEEAKKKIAEIEGRIGDRGTPRILWMVRFMFFGLSPIAVALFALLHSGANLKSFLHAFITYG